MRTPGGGGSAQGGQGGGGQKLAKFYGRLLWMAPQEFKRDNHLFFHLASRTGVIVNAAVPKFNDFDAVLYQGRFSFCCYYILTCT